MLQLGASLCPTVWGVALSRTSAETFLPDAFVLLQGRVGGTDFVCKLWWPPPGRWAGVLRVHMVGMHSCISFATFAMFVAMLHGCSAEIDASTDGAVPGSDTVCGMTGWVTLFHS